MTDITTERVIKFRQKLKDEMFGDQLWYCKRKGKCVDVIVFHPECPYAVGKKGRVAEHRYIWWVNHPNDPIQYNEMIHHIDNNHTNNKIENLMKVKMKQHGQLHKELT
jgi:hypothetical protein